MASDYTIQINSGTIMPLAKPAASGAILAGNHQAQESFSLTFPRRLASAGFVTPFSKLVLREGNTVRFVGWNFVGEPRNASPSSQKLTSVFTGGWGWLERKFYTPNDSGFTVIGKLVPESETADAEHSPLRQCIIDVLDHAQAACGNKFTYTPLAEDLFDIEIPWKSQRGTLCSTILQSLFAYVPTAALRWSYDGTTPNLEIVDTAGEDPSHTLNDSFALTNIPKLHTRVDLLRDSVVVEYRKNDQPAGANDVAPSGGDAATLGANFTQLYTFALQGDEPVPAPGLAAALAAWHQTAHVDTELEMKGLDWSWRPGEVWGYAVGSKFGAWSNYKSVAQSVTRNFFTRRQAAVLGVPAVPSTYRLSKTSDSNDSTENKDTGSLKVTIKDADDVLIAGALWNAGSGNVANEGSADFKPGKVTVFILVPLDYKTPAPVDYTIVKGETLEPAPIRCDHRSEIILQDDDQFAPKPKITISTQEIVDAAPPTGHNEAKFREVEIMVDGALKLTMACILDPYTRDS
ncbi:hypothetical protein BH09VER1_BH09VER1_28310 [soil metagenome]